MDDIRQAHKINVEDEKSKTQPKNVCGSMNAIGPMSTIKDGAFRFGVMQESGAGLRSRVS